MAGRTIRVCPPRDFDFGGLGNSGEEEILIAERIDASQYDQLDLMVRVHDNSAIPSGGKIEVLVVSDGFTTDDPSEDFFSAALSNGVQFNGDGNGFGPTAGTFELDEITSDLGAMVAVRVKGTQPATAVTNFTARLSIDLALKTC